MIRLDIKYHLHLFWIISNKISFAPTALSLSSFCLASKLHWGAPCWIMGNSGKNVTVFTDYPNWFLCYFYLKILDFPPIARLCLVSLALWCGSAWALLPQNFNGQLQAILTHQKNPSVDKLHQVIGSLEGSIGLLAKALPTVTTAFEGIAGFFCFIRITRICTSCKKPKWPKTNWYIRKGAIF